MDKTLMDPDLPDGGHLPPERLAALADESPSAVEAHHLASCAVCAEEVAAYQALLTLTRGERDRLGEPLTDWAALSAALAKGAILDAATPVQAPARRRARSSSMFKPLTQATAAALLVASGVAIGRWTARSMPPEFFRRQARSNVGHLPSKAGQ